MSKPSKLLISLALALALAAVGILGASPAFAWGRTRVFVGFNVGPYWGPYWGPYPYYYPGPVYYPVVVSPPQPVQYVERSEPLQSGYWYYCEPSRAYYPYVKECPSAWRAVAPTPPGQ